MVLTTEFADRLEEMDFNLNAFSFASEQIHKYL